MSQIEALMKLGMTEAEAREVLEADKVIEKGKEKLDFDLSPEQEQEAKKSALLNGQKITNVPNCIDTHIYKKGNKQEARQRLGLPADKKLILFASQRVTNENKGMSYLIEACKQLANSNGEKPGVVILGGHAEEVVAQLPLQAYPLGCGVPCVGFRVGGIPEEIDHKKNGYVAEYRNAEDLARGISWILNEADYRALSENAIHKVTHNYSQQSVAVKYLDVYHQAMAFKHYNL